ncbi:MAG: ATP-binding protein, partial [Aquificota bacterium]|nr:ATP-binding protein [Aquificota bacterium]
GVLSLDEFPEFSRKVIEALRQPLEDGYVNVSRAKGRVTFPARFTLITAQNPCPCGNYGNPFRECTCTANQIRAYNSRVSAPIRDRIDMTVWVDPVRREDLMKNTKGETSREIYSRVLRAYNMQRERFKDSPTDVNGRMTNREVERFCLRMLEGGARKLLNFAVERFNLTARGYFRVLKVARTVADLEESEVIKEHHLAQALQFRWKDSTP